MSGDKIRIICIDRHELKRMQVDAYGNLSGLSKSRPLTECIDEARQIHDIDQGT